jgi:hypothetical protein
LFAALSPQQQAEEVAMFPRIKSFGLFVAFPLGIPAASARAQTEPIRLGVLTDMRSLYADIETLGLQSAQGATVRSTSTSLMART